MELKLIRKEFFPGATRGELHVDGQFQCLTLEDKDRGLEKDMQLVAIQAIKVPHETCIPYGRYQVIVNLSNRFQRLMPLLLGVPGFEGIRIHTGNKAVETDGCILVGKYKGAGEDVASSVLAYNELFPKLRHATEHEGCWIEIIKEQTKEGIKT